MNIGQSISYCFSNYFNFSGRGSRSEYWWFYLFTILVGWGAQIVSSTMYTIGDPMVSLLPTIISLVFMLPVLAAGSRRLHDIGKSGRWQMISIAIIGLIPLIIWLASDTKASGDKYSH